MNGSDLAERAIACKHWRWMAGMRSICMDGTGRGYRRTMLGGTQESGRVLRTPAGKEQIPDLDDPATLGCLLALVREAWGDDLACVTALTGGSWKVWLHGYGEHIRRVFLGGSEAIALVDALEAAP